MVVRLITKLSKEHSNSPFAYQNTEDISQDIWVISLEAIEQFDVTKFSNPKLTLEENLERFLRKTISNRLINRFKELTKNVKSPCPKCPYYDPSKETPGNCKQFGEEKYQCDKWKKYQTYVSSRNSLLNATEGDDNRSDANEPSEHYSQADLLKTIEEKMPSHLLQDFKSLINGQRLPKSRQKQIIENLHEILSDQCDDYEWGDLLTKFGQLKENMENNNVQE